MDEKDWGFAIGELGDPLADIKDHFLLPFPEWFIKRMKSERIRNGGVVDAEKNREPR